MDQHQQLEPGAIVLALDLADAAALTNAGAVNVLCLGASGDRFAIVAKLADQLEGREVILALRDGQAGDQVAAEAGRRFGADRCRRVRWPDGGDAPVADAVECLQVHGDQVVRECIAAAQPLPIAGLHTVDDYVEELQALYRSPRPRGYSTGFVSVDRLFRLKPGELTVVTGIPNHGKSEFVDAICVNAADNHGWKTALCSFENPPPEHLLKLAEKRMGVPFHAGPSMRMTEPELDQALAWLQRHFLFIRAEDTDAPTIDFVLEKARAAALRHAIRILVIDPYNFIEAQRPDRMTETEYVSQMLTKVKRFARSHDVHVFFVAHPAKLYRDAGKLPVPNLYDISGSSHWYNKADNGLIVHRLRENNTDLAEIWLKKIRFKSTGQVGMCRLRYQRLNGRYADDIEDADREAPDDRAA